MFLTYLQETNSTVQIPSILADSYDFARGFVNGTNVMKAVPSLQACDPVTDRMVQSVAAFVSTLKNITTENYQEALINATNIGRDIYDEFAKALPKCLSTINETNVFAHKLITHIMESGYTSKILTHATQNLIEVFQRVARIQGHVSAAHHFDAGVESGSFFNFLFFHDFALLPKFLVLIKSDVKTAQEFGKGFINGTSVMKAVPSLASCDPVNNKTIQLANDLVGAINNITFDNLMPQLQLITTIGVALAHEIATNIPTCTAAGKEAIALATKLSAHVSQSGYTEKIMSHAMTNIFEIMTRVNNIQNFIGSTQHFKAGVESGSFFNFLFLHDFILAKHNVVAFFKSDANTAQDFGKGFINGTNVMKAIPSVASCDPVNNKTIQLANDLVVAINNITIDNYMTQFAIIAQIGTSLAHEIATNVPTCAAAGKEVLALATKLSAHVSKSGYVEKIMSHAMTNIFEIMTRVSKIQSFISAAQHFNAGAETGSFFNFFFLHDFIL